MDRLYQVLATIGIVATLSTTLSTAKPSTTSPGRSSYPVPKVSNPYTRLGAQNSGGLQGGNQGLYAALMQSGQFNRPAPSTEFNPQYNFDPVLSKLQGLAEMNIANARSEAATAKKQSLIDAGSQELAKSLGADQNTQEAAQQNPFSTWALLQKEFGDRSRQLDDSLNQQNLFYSGERVRQMGDLEQGRARAETDFGAKLRELFSGIDSSLVGAEEAELNRQIEAQIAAGGGGIGGGPVPAPGGDFVPGAEPLAAPPVVPPVAPDAGSFASFTPSQPVGMESPGAMYIPSLGFRAPVDPYDEALAKLLQGSYPASVAY